MGNISPDISAAVDKIRVYVSEVTGIQPTDAEIAKAVTGYFVLKEIGEYIAMYRGENSQGNDSSGE